MDGGILSEEAVVSNWRKLTHSALPAVRVRVRVRVLAATRGDPSVLTCLCSAFRS